MTLTVQIAVFLGATVLAVPLFRRLHLSAILGYLAAGVIIGPSGLGVIDDGEGVMHIAEFGVVLLLFVIGLELQPSRLRASGDHHRRLHHDCAAAGTADQRCHRHRLRTVTVVDAAGATAARRTSRIEHSTRPAGVRDSVV